MVAGAGRPVAADDHVPLTLPRASGTIDVVRGSRRTSRTRPTFGSAKPLSGPRIQGWSGACPVQWMMGTPSVTCPGSPARRRNDMKLGLAGLAGAALLVAAVAQADVFITDYYGFSWETTPSGQYVPLQSGNTYDIDGVVDAILAPLTSDFQHNQYTFAIQGGVQNGPAAVVGSGVDFRGAYTEYQVGYFDGANFSVYEDPLAGGTSANWGVNPPNATSPSTFVDGSPYLTATTR